MPRSARDPSPLPPPPRTQPRRRTSVALSMFRPAHRLTIRVPEMPGLTSPDQAAHQLTVDQLRAPARTAPSAAHHSRSNQRRPPPPSPTMRRRRIQPRLQPRTRQPLTTLAAEPVVRRSRNKLASAPVTPASPEREPLRRHLRAAGAALAAKFLIPMNSAERPRTPRARF